MSAKKKERTLQAELRTLLDREVASVEDAELVAEAARLLRDLLRVEQQAEALLERATGEPAARAAEPAVRYETAHGFEGLALHEAARRVLAAAGAPLHVRDLGARIKAGGWRHPRASRPQPDQIEFQLAARLPRYPAWFRRVAPNTFGLAEWGEASAPRRARPRLNAVRGRGPKLARRIGDDPALIHGEQPRWRSS